MICTLNREASTDAAFLSNELRPTTEGRQPRPEKGRPIACTVARNKYNDNLNKTAPMNGNRKVCTRSG